MSYDLVNQILHGAAYLWPTECAPAPKATAKALETATPEETAARLERFCRDAAAGLPDPGGYPNGAYLMLRHRYFERNTEYWEYNTSLALGFIHEIPVPHWSKAMTVTEWWQYQEENRSYLGYPMLPLDDKDGLAERNGRWEACKEQNIPLDWKLNGLTMIYQLLTREGLISLWRGRGYFGMEQQYEGGDFRRFLGFTPQMVLDNLHAAHRQMDPRVKWLPGGVLVEGWED